MRARGNINSMREFFWLKFSIFFSFFSNYFFSLLLIESSKQKIYTRCRQTVWSIRTWSDQATAEHAMRSKACQVGCQSTIFLENNLRWSCFHSLLCPVTTCIDCVRAKNTRFFGPNTLITSISRLMRMATSPSFRCNKSEGGMRMCPQNANDGRCGRCGRWTTDSPCGGRAISDHLDFGHRTCFRQALNALCDRCTCGQMIFTRVYQLQCTAGPQRTNATPSSIAIDE